MWKGDRNSAKTNRQNAARPARRDTLLNVRGRSSENRQARIRIWVRSLGAAGIAGLLLWISISGAQTILRTLFRENPRYTVRTLELHSDGRLTPEMIRRFGGLSEGMNLFELDLKTLRKNLLAVPIIRSVHVERRLPDTIRVRVSERIPLVRIPSEGQVVEVAVDREGVILGPTYSSPVLPRIEADRIGALFPGSRVAREDVMDAIHLIEMCDSTRVGQLVKITEIRVEDEDRLVLRLAAGDEVPFLRRQMESRLLRLAVTLKSIQDQHLRQGGCSFFIDMTTEKNVPVCSLAH